MEKPTQELVLEWKKIYEEYRPKLSDNRLSADDVINYIQERYVINKTNDENFKDAIVFAILNTEIYKNRVPEDTELNLVLLSVENYGEGERLYQMQENRFIGHPIIVGIEFVTGLVFVNGSSDLADEITAFQGLSSQDLDNYYLVANYVKCREKVGIPIE